MKIMHLMSTHSFSGAENVACQIINCSKKRNDNSMVYVSEIKENEVNLKNRNIEYYELKKFNVKNIKNAIKIIKPDIIHAHDIKSSIMAALLATKEIKVISHIHNNHENMRKINIKTCLYNMCCKRFEKIIWVSKSAFEQYIFKGKINNKSVILYNVISREEIIEKVKLDSNIYDYDIVYLGRLTYQKNPMKLLEIMSLIKEKYDDVKLAIIGEGDLKIEMEKYIKEKKLEKNITLFGFKDNPYKILNDSKMMIMTSRFEGTPMAALEAMSLGKPIVSTPTDGLKDIVIPNETGFLSEDNREITNFIINTLKDEKKLNGFSKNTIIQFNKICNIDEYINKINGIYEI